MPVTRSNVVAIVPAAGIGRRFRAPPTRPGEPEQHPGDADQRPGHPAPAGDPALPKQLYRIDGRSMLAAVLDELEASRAAAVVVVVNPLIAEAIQAERPPGNRRCYVINDRPGSEMIESVQMGLARALEWEPAGSRGYLICPGDHPDIRVQTIDACIAAGESAPDGLIVTTYQGRRGHPIILPADLAREVMSWPATDRLDGLRTRHPERVRQVEVDDPGALIDVDTYDDLRPG